MAALTFVAAVLSLALKKEQPAYAFLVSVCAAAGAMAVVVQQIEPVMDWLRTLNGIFPGQGISCLLRVLGIAIIAQLASDICREAGLAAAATAVELGGRVLALLQALPLLQGLLASYAGYLQ
ncbi:SpoIIIAC/SpoIIIAD family protein [Subdoligranulum variabile]|uniref:SpoIIIAC/SpoIIIAD family protein n=1 Tax=Subdoligranulum variabile TaxID=214851 RepID=UPI0026EC5F31|nr:SpoIIIAC/SpoIIIAD family protein [Subdoligranulum variabile]